MSSKTDAPKEAASVTPSKPNGVGTNTTAVGSTSAPKSKAAKKDQNTSGADASLQDDAQLLEHFQNLYEEFGEAMLYCYSSHAVELFV